MNIRKCIAISFLLTVLTGLLVVPHILSWPKYFDFAIGCNIFTLLGASVMFSLVIIEGYRNNLDISKNLYDGCKVYISIVTGAFVCFILYQMVIQVKFIDFLIAIGTITGFSIFILMCYTAIYTIFGERSD